MATQTEQTRHLQKEVEHLRGRVQSLVDEMFVLKNELSKFKSDVASDVKYLTNRVDG